MNAWQRAIGAWAGATLLAGCMTVTEQVSQVERLEAPDGSATVLLFEPDIKFYILTAGGIAESQPDWTQAARRNFMEAARASADRQNLSLKLLPTSVPDLELERYERLHQAVGITILNNYLGPWKLPSKADKFDLTLGSGVDVLRERYGADYGLFVFYRDLRASGGSIAFALLAGAYEALGSQFGFASLVDLRTGAIVWFNKVSLGAGDLRETAGAQATVETLLEGMPHG
jgi:hypothetical protein